METHTPGNKVATIKNLYLYLVSFVALMMLVFSVADLVNVVLKTWVFPKADEMYAYYPSKIDCMNMRGPDNKPTMTEADCERQDAEARKRDEENRIARRQNSVVRDISMIVVAIPLFAYHWRIIRKKENN